jgi:hypothetical protein
MFRFYNTLYRLVFISSLFVCVSATAVRAGCAGPCPGIRSCKMNLHVPSLNTSFEVIVSGPACACVSSDGTKLEWKSSEFRGTHPTLGDLHIALLKSLGNSSITSTGTITPLSPSALSSSDSDFFPAVNVNFYPAGYKPSS